MWLAMSVSVRLTSQARESLHLCRRAFKDEICNCGAAAIEQQQRQTRPGRVAMQGFSKSPNNEGGRCQTARRVRQLTIERLSSQQFMLSTDCDCVVSHFPPTSATRVGL